MTFHPVFISILVHSWLAFALVNHFKKEIPAMISEMQLNSPMYDLADDAEDFEIKFPLSLMQNWNDDELV